MSDLCKVDPRFGSNRAMLVRGLGVPALCWRSACGIWSSQFKIPPEKMVDTNGCYGDLEKVKNSVFLRFWEFKKIQKSIRIQKKLKIEFQKNLQKDGAFGAEFHFFNYSLKKKHWSRKRTGS